MIENLLNWLQQNQRLFRDSVLQRDPNLLPDGESIIIFLNLLSVCLGEKGNTQLRLIQSWAFSNIGDDQALANDWLIMIRLLKETISDLIMTDFPAEQGLLYWRELDRGFTYALIEITRLASSSDYSKMLAYIAELQRQTEVLEQSKSNFITVAAHELRTPLTVMEGYAKMMQGLIPPDCSQLELMLDGFQNGLRRLKSIIGDMIDATMIDAQTLSIYFQPVYLDKLLQMVVDKLADSFAERNVKLEVRPLVLKEPIYGDPSRLYQAFTKLLSNGLKYTPDGGQVMVHSAMVRQDEINEEIHGYIDIRFADTGIGIYSSDLEEIFKKFVTKTDVAHHSSGSTKFRGGGPGLGLPIVRGIINAHGGRVWAESLGFDEVRCPGSTFHVELPVRVKMPN